MLLSVADNAVKTRSCQAVEQRMITVLLYLCDYLQYIKEVRVRG
jgi:hypothetical protein